MSCNLARTDCRFCDGVVRVVGEPHMRGRIGNKLESLADAECVDCEAKYLAWLDPWPGWPRVEGQTHYDLSFRSTFNDEPGKADMPKWKVIRGIVRKEPWE